jgi:hypothetical protein
VLAPIAPAMSDAQDIRTQRTQDAAKFASDQALSQAQLTVRQLAAQGDSQKNQEAQTVREQLGVPLRSYTDANGSQHTVYFTKDGQTKDIQDTPSASERLQSYISTLKQNGVKVTPEQEAAIAPGFYGQHTAVGAGAKPVTLKGPDGQPMGASFTNGRYFDANGDEVANPVLWEKPPAAAHPPSPATMYTNLLAKQIMANNKQGPPLTPQEVAQLKASGQELTLNGEATARARAVENARYGITTMTDDSGQEVDQTRLNIANMVDAGDTVAAGSQGRSTSMDKKNQGLAKSALTQIDSMERVLAADPNLTGPGSGQLTKFQTWLGSGSEDAQQFLAAATFLADHGVGVFGGRNIHSIDDLQKLMGDLKTNPAALKAALEQARTTMTPWATAGGRLPGQKNKQVGNGGGQFVVIDPNKKPHAFDTQAQADAFRKLIAPK